MKSLVTGGLGFIGRALVKALLQAGDNVRILDNQARSHARVVDFGGDAELLLGDIRDRDLTRKAMDGVDRVFHLAAINGTKNFYQRPREVLEVGILGTLWVMEAAVDMHVPEVLVMSSSEVYQTPPSIPTDERVAFSIPDPCNPRYSYAGSKIAGELLAINYARDALQRLVIVRPHNVYGEDMGTDHVIPELASLMLKEAAHQPHGRVSVPLQGGGTSTRAFIHIQDFIAGCMLAMNKGEHLGIYHIGTQDEVSIIDLAHQIAKMLRLEVDFYPAPSPRGQTQRRCPDISKIRSLGFCPKISLETGLEMTLQRLKDV